MSGNEDKLKKRGGLSEQEVLILNRLATELGCPVENLTFLFEAPRSISAYSADIAIPQHTDKLPDIS